MRTCKQEDCQDPMEDRHPLAQYCQECAAQRNVDLNREKVRRQIREREENKLKKVAFRG